MNASRLLSDISGYALVVGLVALLYGIMWTLASRAPGRPDADDPDPRQRTRAGYWRAAEMFGRPMLIGGAILLVLAGILVIASRLVP